MATIESYETSSGKRYQVRYRTPEHKQTKQRGFRTKRDAEQFAASVEVQKYPGEFVSHQAGQATVGELGPSWLGRQSAPDPADFGTTFTRIAPNGYVDMSLDFENPTDHPVTLSGRLIARNGSNSEMPRVVVTTAFETEKGRAVVMPGGSVDFVQLRGPGAEQVRDVSFEDVSVTKAQLPVVSKLVKLTPLDTNGVDLDYDMDAQQVRLENPNGKRANVRVVLMVLRAPQDGVPQQAILVRDVATVHVEPKASKTVDLDSKTISILQARGVNSFVTLRPVLAP